MKNIYTFTLFMLLIYLNGFSQNVMEKVIEIPWNTEEGCKLVKLPHNNHGISSFQIISDNELAVLCETENKIKIFDLKTGELSFLFSYDRRIDCQLFRYSEKLERFYLYDNYKYNIMAYSREGKLIENIPVARNIIWDGIVQLKVLDDNLIAVCGYRVAYTLIKNGAPLAPEEQEATKTDGVYDEKGHIIKINKTGKTDFEIISSENSNKKYPLSFEWDYETDMKYIGGNDYFFALVVIHLTPEESKSFQRKLVFYSRINNKINNIIDMPHIYYTSQYNSIELFNNTIFQLFTKPTHAVLLKYNYGVIKSPDIDNIFDFDYPKNFLDFDIKYYYDSEDQIYNEPSVIPDESKEQQSEKYFDGNTNNPIMGSQIIYRAKKYLYMQWNATEANIAHPQGDVVPIGGGYLVQTPNYISTTQINESVPYKWGGFTHYNDFIAEANNGKYTGDVSLTSPFEIGDNQVIGVDCSGLVSRAWNRSNKFGTANLHTISTQYNNFNLARRGDIILIREGQGGRNHACVVRDNNSSLTSVNVIEAVANVRRGRVRVQTYTSESSPYLTGYTPMHYNLRDNFDLHFSNFNINESPIYEQGSINLTVTVNNVGTAAFTGNVRAMVYNVFNNPNTDELGNSLFQIGENTNTTINSNGNSVLNFSINEIPAAITEGTYLVAIEFDRGGNNWSKIPRYDFEGLQEITITQPDPPVADFSYSATVGDFPLTVQFTDQSIGNPTSWYWSFGGAYSSEQNPSYTFDSPGTYLVSLNVTNSGGSDTKTVQITLEEGLGAYFSASTTSGQRPLTVHFFDQSTGSPTQWLWDFGDGNSSTENNPTHTYNSVGVFNVVLYISNGSATSESEPLIIHVAENMISITGNAINSNTFHPINDAKVTLDPGNSIDYTSAYGSFTNSVPAGWEGTISIQKQNGVNDSFSYTNELGPFWHNTDLGNILIFPIGPINLEYEKLFGYTYKFTVSFSNIGSLQYNWTIKNSLHQTIHSSQTIVPTLIFDFSGHGNGNYKIEVLVDLGNNHIIQNSLQLNISPGFEANFSYLTNICSRIVPLGHPVYFLDTSGPFYLIGRAMITGYDTPEPQWYFKNGTINCNTSIGSPYPEDRIFSIIYNEAGYNNSLFSVAGFNCLDNLTSNANDLLEFLVVDCSTIATSNDFTSAIERKHSFKRDWYCGNFILDDMRIPEFNYSQFNNDPNRVRHTLFACNEIKLMPGFHSKPELNVTHRLKIDHCLNINNIPVTQKIKSEYSKNNYFLNADISEIIDILNVWPNPNNGLFNVKLNSETDFIKRIHLLSSSGYVIKNKTYNKNSIFLDITQKPDGLYLIIIYTSEGLVLKRKILKTYF